MAASAYVRSRYGDDALILALAADHVVTDPKAFLASVEEAAKAAEAGHIVTFGIQPRAASTAYGLYQVRCPY